MLETERQGGVGIIRLSRGITNAINSELVAELTAALEDMILNDSEIKVILLTSSNDKFFAIGFDLPEVLELSRSEFQEFYQGFNKLTLLLYKTPKPTVAALTGHATAGGCILALCCDYRIIGQGRTLMGLNEVKLGVPVPYPGDVILRDLVGTRHAREIMEIGEFYQPDKLLELGMVDEIVPKAEVRAKALEKAHEYLSLPSPAFQVIKKNRIQPVMDRIQEKLAVKEQQFLACWFSEETQSTLRKAMEKF
ncbi:MAG: enoyl-CoA hydratase/isomerase family protein [Candidatus Thorarchaeota archaeon]